MAFEDWERELVFEGYVEAGLWSSTDNSDDAGGDPLDANYGIADIAAESVAMMGMDVAAFLGLAETDVRAIVDGKLSEWGFAGVGHDLWLTRNRHGAGFWDRGYPKDLGDRLTSLSHSLGERSLVVGDDGAVYCERG